MKKNCERCGVEFEDEGIDWIGGVKKFFRRSCFPCAEIVQQEADTARREQEEREVKERNARRWKAICPPLFDSTDESRLPAQAFKLALAWKYSPTGLILHGPTGTGKSRIAYKLLWRLFGEGLGIRAYTAAEFRRAYARAAMEDGGAEPWMEKVIACDILYLDDLGQMKMTESAEETLMEVIDGRTRNLNPIIATTQYVGSELAKQFTREQRGAAVVRRLTEFCEAIPVRKK